MFVEDAVTKYYLYCCVCKRETELDRDAYYEHEPFGRDRCDECKAKGFLRKSQYNEREEVLPKDKK